MSIAKGRVPSRGREGRGRQDRARRPLRGAARAVLSGGRASRPVEIPILVDATRRGWRTYSRRRAERDDGMPRLRARLASDPADLSPATLRVKVDEVAAEPGLVRPEDRLARVHAEDVPRDRERRPPRRHLLRAGRRRELRRSRATAFIVQLEKEDRVPPRIEVLAPAEARRFTATPIRFRRTHRRRERDRRIVDRPVRGRQEGGSKVGT